MSCLRERLAPLSERVSAELPSRLAGPFGGVLRAYLPQRWVVEADADRLEISVDRLGKCALAPAPPDGPAPDVTIRIGHDALRAALDHGTRPGSAAGPYSVVFGSEKGETAFRFLRSRFGL